MMTNYAKGLGFFLILLLFVTVSQTSVGEVRVAGQLVTDRNQDNKTGTVNIDRQTLRSLCGHRSRCKCVSIDDAGPDIQKNELRVIKLDLCEADSCSPEPGEIWFVKKKDGTLIGKQLLVKMRDSSAASKVGINRFQFEDEYGAMGYGGRQVFTIQLSPLLVLSVDGGNRNGGPGTGIWENLWWNSLDGTVRDYDIDEKAGDPYPREYHPIPQVTGPNDWLSSKWNQTSLGSCGLSLGSEKSPGFVLVGDSTTIPNVEIVMPSKTDLLVEVASNSFVTGSTRWLDDDHLEIWIVHGAKAKQWGIRIADGAVFPAFGNPKEALMVETARYGGDHATVSRLFKIHWPFAADRVTVSYSKGNGTRVVGLISSSRLIYGHAETVGEIRVIAPEFGSCVLSDHSMSFRGSRVITADEPIINCTESHCFSNLLPKPRPLQPR